MTTDTTDFLIIGGGVIGINLVLQAKRRFPDSSVTLLEKEKDCGEHASGRNSGVLHAGFYYTADSLKAKFTKDGCRILTEYCTERGLGINHCGKIVIAKNDEELPVLDELLARAEHNKVALYEISEEECKDIEPRARFYKRALFSPTTASVDPKEVMRSFVSDAKQAGIKMLTGTQYLGFKDGVVSTSQGNAVSPAFTCSIPFRIYLIKPVN